MKPGFSLSFLNASSLPAGPSILPLAHPALRSSQNLVLEYVRTGEIPEAVDKSVPFDKGLLLQGSAKVDAEYGDLSAAYLQEVVEQGEIDLAETERYDLMMRNWLETCLVSDPKAAFQSLYNVLIHVESKGNDGFLSIGQHSALLKLAALAADRSDFTPVQKFIAAYSLCRFVGSPQNKILDDPLGPMMQEALLSMKPRDFGGVCRVLYLMPDEWDLVPEEEPIDITGREDDLEGFDAAPSGYARDRAMFMTAEHLRDHPELRVGLAQQEGADFTQQIINSMEDAGVVNEDEAKAWSVGLLGFSPQPAATEEDTPGQTQG